MKAENKPDMRCQDRSPHEGHDWSFKNAPNKTVYHCPGAPTPGQATPPPYTHRVEDGVTVPVEGEGTPDMVNHPPHYQQGGMEVIDVLTAFFPNDPLLWQAGKYIMRAGRKVLPGQLAPILFVQDLEKARWYLDRRIEEIKSGGEAGRG